VRTRHARAIFQHEIPGVATKREVHECRWCWLDRGIAARLAYATMLMSRKRMVEFHAETDHEQVDQLPRRLWRRANF